MSGIRAEHLNVSQWLDLVGNGSAQLPEFQRDFVWSPDKTEKFLHAILEERPVGFLLVLKVDPTGDAPFNPRAVEGSEILDHKPIQYLILDGQQRITSLWSALMDKSPDGRRYFICYPQPHGRFNRLVTSMRQLRWHDTPRECLNRGLVPLRLLRHTRSPEDLAKVHSWVDAAVVDDMGKAKVEEQRPLEDWIGRRGEQLRTFDMPHLLMPEDTSPTKAIETFVESNTSSVKLKKFDIATAENLASKTSNNLRITRQRALESVENLGRYMDVPTTGDLLLKIACLRTGYAPVESKFRDPKVLQDVNAHGDEIIAGIRWVVELLGEDRIWDRRRLPSIVPFRVLPALHGYYSKARRSKGNIRKTARAYLWRAFLTERYKSSAATLLKEDFDGLKRVIRNNADARKCVPIWKEKLPRLADIGAASWPTKTALGKAILAISVRRGSRDISTGQELRQAGLAEREYHHIFPDSYLRNNAPSAHRDAAVNCILIDGKTNRSAADKPPLEYLHSLVVRIAGSKIDTRDLEKRLQTHLVPMRCLDLGNRPIQSVYTTFAKERSQLIFDDMRKLVNGDDP